MLWCEGEKGTKGREGRRRGGAQHPRRGRLYEDAGREAAQEDGGDGELLGGR